MEDLTGKQLGPYRIVAPLGEGGMAAVYKAYQPGIDRYVALKILPRHFATDPQFVGRFHQEAKVIAKLQHPHILPVHDFGEADGYTYIVMPFVESGTLADLLGGEALTLKQIHTIVSQVGDALDYAHSFGLIHRDVKPSNVLLDQRGNCLLTDFGIAKLLEGTVSFTSTGGIVGTPAYMSPEQGLGQKLDGRSDIYSLGVMLYEMATGRVPYSAETPMAVVLKHINDPLPPPRSVNPLLPEPTERVILKAMAKSPHDRYPTARAMIEAFGGALETERYDGGSADLIGPGARPRRRPTRWSQAGAVVAALAGIAIGLWLLRSPTVKTVAGPTTEASLTQAPLPTALAPVTWLPTEEPSPAAPASAVAASTGTLLADSFDDPHYAGKYNPSLWSCGSPCAFGKVVVSQDNNSIRLEVDEGSGGLASQSSWSSDQVGYVQGRLKLEGTDSGGVNLQLVTTLASGVPWAAGCFIQRYSTSKGEYGCELLAHPNGEFKSEYRTESFPVDYDEWHTARIELIPDTFELRFFLDGMLIGHHTPSDVDELKSRFLGLSFGGYTDTHLVASVDDVLVAPVTTATAAPAIAAALTPTPLSRTRRVLFDESHGGLSLDPIRAATLDPYHPEYAYAGIFAKEVGKSYPLDPLTNGPITPDVLANHQILVLSAPNGWYSPQEAETILDFVRRGGGLLVFGVDGAGSQNLITEPLGVGFAGRPMASELHFDWGPWGFKADIPPSSGLLAGVSHVTLNADAALEVNSPASIIASTSANTWLDLDQNQIRDADERVGPFPYAAQSQLGQGRAVIFSGAVWGSFFYDNQDFIMNALEWLAGA